MELNRRGMFFTLLGLALVALLITTITVQRTTYYQQNQFVISNRLDSMNSFINNLKQDAGIALYTSGFRSMVALNEHVATTGTYVSDVTDGMEELMQYGTYGGAPSFLLVNNTMINWTASMQQQASRIGIILNVTLLDVDIYHSDPWHVRIDGTFQANLTDNRDLASWNFTFLSSAQMSILGLDDPLWVKETGNQLARVINVSPYRGEFVVSGDTGNLTDHMTGGHYIAFSAAPNYLMRLEGNLSPHLFGIESLIDKNVLGGVMLVDNSKTNVDHLYFSLDYPTVYGFVGMPPTFALDNETNGSIGRIALYNLSAQVT